MNVSEVADRLGLDEDEYMDLLLLFIESELPDLNAMQSHIECGNIVQAIELVHSMKGAAGNLGLIDIHKASSALEGKLRNGKLGGYTRYIKEIRRRLFHIAGLTRSTARGQRH